MQHDVDDLLQDLERIEESFFEELSGVRGVVIDYKNLFRLLLYNSLSIKRDRLYYLLRGIFNTA